MTTGVIVDRACQTAGYHIGRRVEISSARAVLSTRLLTHPVTAKPTTMIYLMQSEPSIDRAGWLSRIGRQASQSCQPLSLLDFREQVPA